MSVTSIDFAYSVGYNGIATLQKKLENRIVHTMSLNAVKNIFSDIQLLHVENVHFSALLYIQLQAYVSRNADLIYRRS